MSQEKKGILKSTVQITGLTFISIILSFVTQLVVAYYFGTTSERDAYFAALVVPTYITAVLIGSIGVMFLPLYVDTQTKKSEKEANYFLKNAVTFSSLISIIISLAGIFYAKSIISYTFPGFKGEQISLTTELLIILFPGIVFQFVTNLASSVLQVNHRFLLPALTPILAALLTLISVLILSPYIGIRSLAYGTLVGYGLSCFITFYSLREKVSFSFFVTNKNIELVKLIKLSAPLLITGVFYRLTGVFERGIASSLSEGSISYLGYANQIMNILATLTSSGIAITIYPLLSKAWSENNLEQLRKLFIKGIRSILLLAIPISLIFIFWGIPIFQFIFEHGAFNHEATIAVSSTFSILSIAFIANCLGGIIAKIFYFSHRTIQGSILEIVSTLSYLLLAYYLSKLYSYKGLAMASSLSAILSITFSFVSLYIIVKKINVQQILNAMVVGSISSILPILVMNTILQKYLLNIDSSIFIVSFCILTSLTSYYFLLKLFKTEEINMIQFQIKQYLQKAKSI